jgi:hypothetical protein
MSIVLISFELQLSTFGKKQIYLRYLNLNGFICKFLVDDIQKNL